MKALICLGTLAVLLSGCANVYAPLLTKAHSATPPTKDAAYAFAVDANTRVEKVEYYKRAKAYFTQAGYRITDAEHADYRIDFLVFGPRKLKLRYEVPYVQPLATAPSARRTITHRVTLGDDRSLFTFVVYPNTHHQNGSAMPVWEATVSATEETFREHEEEFVQKIFAHAGEDFDGELVLKKATKT